ncbi:hypothetical protein [Streptomyces sp. NPDC088196]|uniref:hypothetical protein n=1 Tax=Streptomyces sp. NPDC088196 TaxID=3154868 RepID=UPI00344BFCE1
MTDQHHEADLDRVSAQNSITDFVRGVEDGPRGGVFNGIIRSAVGCTPYGQSVAHGTDFGERKLELNDLIDLVEQTDPEDLESSGKALWDARDAIKAAAKELDGHIDRVHWVGESGDAFREWGRSLVTNTHHLSDFAGEAGDQISAAAVGLASVRGAMPHRDTQASRKRPVAFTAVEKTADKAEYAAAVRVEKDRQEAINQMNRLASYYAVSSDTLSTLPAKDKTPEFTTMPDVGVPRPTKEFGVNSPESVAVSHTGTGTPSPVSHHTVVASTGDVTRHSTSDAATPAKHITGGTHPDVPVGTNIDSVGTLPPVTTSPGTVHTPPVTGTPAMGGVPTNGFEGPYGTPIPSASSGRGISGAGGVRTPASAQGRTGTSGVGNSGSGRSGGRGSMNQMGRASGTGQSLAKGAASGAKPSPMGRGVTGGTPRAAGGAAPRTNGGSTTGAGRANGVVGGRPATASRASGNGGSKIPRGTVVGADEPANSRSASGRPGQRGVFGATGPAERPGSNSATRRGGTGASETVTGKPAERNSVARAERNGMTRGGSGLVRGPGGRGKPEDGSGSDGASRPDCLVEDEETHVPTNPRRDVPPVIN